jgi:hypothetical protein
MSRGSETDNRDRLRQEASPETGVYLATTFIASTCVPSILSWEK